LTGESVAIAFLRAANATSTAGRSILDASLEQRRPGSNPGDYDLSADDPNRPSDQNASPSASQPGADLESRCDGIAVTLEDDALAFLELRHALTKTLPFRGVFRGHFLGAGV